MPYLVYLFAKHCHRCLSSYLRRFIALHKIDSDKHKFYSYINENKS